MGYDIYQAEDRVLEAARLAVDGVDKDGFDKGAVAYLHRTMRVYAPLLDRSQRDILRRLSVLMNRDPRSASSCWSLTRLIAELKESFGVDEDDEQTEEDRKKSLPKAVPRRR